MDMVILRLRIKISCLEILLWKSHSNSAFKSHQRSSYPAFASSSSIARSNFVFFSGDGDFPSQIRFRNSSMASVSHGCIAQFPLLSRSRVMETLIADASDEGEEGCIINLSDIPGGDKKFELLARFCYGVKLELSASNVEMIEEYGEGNLITILKYFSIK